jgi:hypothetical protein
MLRQRPTQTLRTWRAPRTVGRTGGARPVRRAVPFAGAHGRATTSLGRLSAIGPGRSLGKRPAAGRRKQSSGNPGIAFGSGLLGAVRRNKRSTGSRKGPALLVVVAGLSAAGAAAFKRRRGGDDQPPGYVPPPDPVGEEPLPTTAAAPPPRPA